MSTSIDELRALLSPQQQKKAQELDHSIKGTVSDIRNSIMKQDPDIDYGGVEHASLRMGLSRMDTDPEREAYLSSVVGPEGWTRDTYGALALTPPGMESLGLKPRKRAAVIDEPGWMTRYDIADFAGSAPEIIGGVGAGMAASGMGFLPGVGLTALGAMTGKAIDEGIEALQGRNLQSLPEIAGDVARVGRDSALGEGVYRGILAPIGRKILAPQAKRVSDASRKLIGQSLEIGARPNVTQVTKAPILGRTQSMMNRIFGDPLAEKNSLALRKEIVRLLHNTGPKAQGQRAGEMVVENITRSRKALSRWSNRVAINIDSMLGSGKDVVPTSGLKQSAMDVMGSIPKSADGSPVMASSETVRFLNDISQLGDYVTIPQAQMIKGQLWDAVSDNTIVPGITSHHASVLHKAAKRMMEEAPAGGRMTPEAGQALNEFTKRYSSEIGKYNDAFIRRITLDPEYAGKIDPMQVVSSLFRKGAGDKINRLMPKLKPNVQMAVRRSAMEDLLGNVFKRTDDPLVQLLDGKSLLDAMDGYGKPTLSAMFGPKTTRELYRFGQVAQFVNQKMAMSGGLVAAHIALHPWQNMGRLVKMNLMSRFMNTDKGMKWLTEGLDVRKTRDAGEFITRLMDQLVALKEE